MKIEIDCFDSNESLFDCNCTKDYSYGMVLYGNIKEGTGLTMRMGWHSFDENSGDYDEGYGCDNSRVCPVCDKLLSQLALDFIDKKNGAREKLQAIYKESLYIED